MPGELGMAIDLQAIPKAEGITSTQILYSETCGRFLVTVDPERKKAFEDLMADVPFAQVGTVTEEPSFRISDSSGTLIQEYVMELKSCWKRPFGDLI